MVYAIFFFLELFQIQTNRSANTAFFLKNEILKFKVVCQYQYSKPFFPETISYSNQTDRQTQLFSLKIKFSMLGRISIMNILIKIYQSEISGK